MAGFSLANVKVKKGKSKPKADAKDMKMDQKMMAQMMKKKA